MKKKTFMFSPSAWVCALHKVGYGWPARLLACGCWACALAMAIVVIGMLVRGDVWAYVIYAENPYGHLALGLLFGLAGFFLWSGYRKDARFWLRLTGRFVLLLCSVGLTALIGEAALRYALYRKQQAGSIDRLREERSMDRLVQSDNPHPMAAIVDVSDNLRLVFELRPHLDMSFGHRVLRTNAQGMRSDKDVAVPKPDGVLRVIGIGDSGMFGWGVHQGEEYLAVLDRALNARGDARRYEVLNLAVPGYNTHLEVESLASKGLAYDPDIVVLGWCDNDYQLPFFMLEREDFTRTDLSFLHTYLFRRKKIADLIAGCHVTSMRGYEKGRVDDGLRQGAGVEGVRRSLERFKALADEHGFHPLVFGPLRPDILEVVRAVGLPYLNTLEAVNAADYPESYAVHFMHPHAEGHAVLGGVLAQTLEANGWLD